ncbi:MAG TPA: hypothetical protein VKN76_10445, partial [Kiloniellaceae bacterium]|nr:hypothetical protein [Kiloniellaceae bacterium]
DRLTPSHAVSHGKRHRYYVSRRLITASGKSDLSGWRLPAKALEGAVANTIADRLQQPHTANDLLTEVTPETLRRLPDKLAEITTALKGPDRGSLLQAVVAEGTIEPGRLTLVLSPQTVAEHLGLTPAALKQDALHLEAAFTLRRRGVEAKLVVGDSIREVDPVLLNAVAKGHFYFEAFRNGIPMRAIAERDGITQRRVAGLMDLAFLAPDIVTAIVEGRQATDLTPDRVLKRRQHLLWTDQRAALLAN